VTSWAAPIATMSAMNVGSRRVLASVGVPVVVLLAAVLLATPKKPAVARLPAAPQVQVPQPNRPSGQVDATSGPSSLVALQAAELDRLRAALKEKDAQLAANRASDPTPK
jgi:hypothetical protein